MPSALPVEFRLAARQLPRYLIHRTAMLYHHLDEVFCVQKGFDLWPAVTGRDRPFWFEALVGPSHKTDDVALAILLERAFRDHRTEQSARLRERPKSVLPGNGREIPGG